MEVSSAILLLIFYGWRTVTMVSIIMKFCLVDKLVFAEVATLLPPMVVQGGSLP